MRLLAYDTSRTGAIASWTIILRHAVYVDNYLVVVHDADDVRKSAARHSEGLVSQGLPVHEVDTCVSEIDYVRCLAFRWQHS